MHTRHCTSEVAEPKLAKRKLDLSSHVKRLILEQMSSGLAIIKAKYDPRFCSQTSDKVT